MRQSELEHVTIYERLGGEPAVAALLEGLYVRALSDAILAPFLKDLDIERLKAHQFAFLSQALGGSQRYSGPTLAAAHARLRLEQRHFDAFLAHLESALDELGASEDLKAEILAQVTPLDKIVVNTPSSEGAAN